MIPNPYVRKVFELNGGHADLAEIVNQKFDNCYWIEPVLSRVQGKKAVNWWKFIDEDVINDLRSGKRNLVYTHPDEGYSYIDTKLFDEFYVCEKYGIDPSKIIYITSNLKDHDNLTKYLKKSQSNRINILSIPFFENVVSGPLEFSPIENWIKHSYKLGKKSFNGKKYFLSLSRANRKERAAGTYWLTKSSLARYAYISHDRLDDVTKFDTTVYLNNLTGKDCSAEIEKWSNKLPLVVDRTDFNVNWAMPEYDFINLHSKALFHIVNETWVRDWNNSSIFYSEKTFKTIYTLHPFVIWGQPGCNKYLKEIGYCTYEDWFDLSFDDERNDLKRYHLMLESVKKAIVHLNALSTKEKLNWRFKNMEVLKTNYENLRNNVGIETGIKKFLTSV